MKRIPLRNYEGKIKHWALVDDEDYGKVKKISWQARKSEGYKTLKVIGKIGRKHFYLSRFIMKPGPEFVVDHINHNTLDNRRSNLRICTQSQNCANMRIGTKNKSGAKGVSVRKRSKKFEADISLGGKGRKHLGSFLTIKEAADAYDKATKKIYGKFAWLNNYPAIKSKE